MNYTLNVESQTYPVEDLRLPAATTLAVQPEGKTLFFVSPVKLPLGKNCALVNETGGFRLEVHGCFGFVYSLKYLVACVIIGKWSPQT